MRFLAGICFVLVCLVGTRAVAAEGVRFGVRAGYAELEGSFFGQNLESREARLFGMQALFPLVGNRLALELAGEGTSDELTFTDSDFGSGVDWSDLALYASVRANLIPAAVFGFYLGGGVGVHFTELDPGVEDDFEKEGRTIDDVWKRESSDMEWHGLAGLDFGLGSLVGIFTEVRFRHVEGEFERDGYAGYAGINLVLP